MNIKLKINLLGVYLLTILLGLTLIALLTYSYKINNILIESLIYVACSGGLGGTIYSIRGFYQSLAAGKFNFNKWAWWYIFRPLISIVIGVFAYFLVVSGFLSIGIFSENNYTKGIMLYLVVSFLAGFSFTQFADRLEKIASTIFSKKKAHKNDS